jgi:hypothetical protein
MSTYLWDPVQIVLGGDDIEDEPLGTKEKFWVLNPIDRHPWLFKFARTVGGQTRGEDWAEWVVHTLAKEIGIPTAEVRPAGYDGRRGIVSKSVIEPGSSQRLVHGNSLLAENSDVYDPRARRENPEYTVAAVYDSLRGVSAPPDIPSFVGLSGFDVWAGYLLLDALVGGRDRHHENWAVISDQEGRSLSPSFDHGNALGFQESDTKRNRCVEAPELLGQWASRGRSHHFAGKPDLVELAHSALQMASDSARSLFFETTKGLDDNVMRSIVECVPIDIMSHDARNFAIVMVEHNKGRVLSEYPAR